jgi:hypothetical protein
MLRVAQLSAYYYIRPNALYSPHRVVASRRGPRTNILLSRTSNLARGSDVDCLIRQTLKFCQLTAGFPGSRLEKKRPLFVVIDTGQKALAIVCSLSVHYYSRSGTQSFLLFCQLGTFFFFFTSAETSDHDSLHTIGTIGYPPHHLLYSCPMIALET